MKTTIRILSIAFIACLASFVATGSASAQTASDSDVNALIQRIKEARAREDRAAQDVTGDTNGDNPPEAKPEKTKETDATAKAKEEKKKAADERARAEKAAATAEKIAKNPRGYLDDMTHPSMPAPSDALRTYDVDRSASDIVSRIHENRSPQEAKEKAKREKEEKETAAVGHGTGGVLPTKPGAQAQDYSRFLTPARAAGGTVGGEVVTEQVLPETKPLPIASTDPSAAAALTRSSTTGELADPTKDPTAYQKEAERTLGIRAALPSYADKGLVGLYATQTFNQAFGQLRTDVRMAPGATLNQTYQAYTALNNIPNTDSIIGRRDVYVPNSQDFLNPTYRGSIYQVPFADNPMNRNYSQYSSLSQYSNTAYNSMNTTQSFQDYYSRSYGTSFGFGAPTGLSFDVNTLKQWSVNLNQNYGVDASPGSMSYSDMYKLQSGLRRR